MTRFNAYTLFSLRSTARYTVPYVPLPMQSSVPKRPTDAHLPKTPPGVVVEEEVEAEVAEEAAAAVEDEDEDEEEEEEEEEEDDEETLRLELDLL